LRESAPITEQISLRIEQHLADCQKVSEAVVTAVCQTYKGTRYMPIWINLSGVSSSARDLITGIENAESHGLKPSHYHLDELWDSLTKTREIPGEQSIDELANFDMLLTRTFYELASDIVLGSANSTIDPDWHIPKRSFDLRSIATVQLVRENKLKEYLENLYPTEPEYERLREALSQYKQIEMTGGWRVLPIPKVPARAFKNKKFLSLLTERLKASFDRPNTVKNRKISIKRALMHFQVRHGLPATGLPDRETIEEMNTPVEVRIQQIEANLERWRWLGNLEERHLMVNVANFDLKLIESDEIIFQSKVAVGKEFRQTPSISSQITQIELNPRWVVPTKIAVEDLLPLLRKDPKLLARQGFRFYLRGSDTEVDPASVDWKSVSTDPFDFRIIQETGPSNAMGKLKFILPNSYGIYLHDTPSKNIFREGKRTVSSGCIRVAKPIALAKLLLRDNPSWDADDLEEKIASQVPQKIKIEMPTPIYVLYWTSWVDQNGVNFRKDIYGRDKLLNKILTVSI